jgi:tRNA threonylcarbamoyl adenosine modification protein YjeE
MMMMNFSITQEFFYDLSEISEVADKILNILFTGSKKWTLLLTGELGAGKTTLARQIIKKIIPEVGFVQSPTFPIMIPYQYNNEKLWHMDFYRLDGDKTKCTEWPEVSPITFSEQKDVVFFHIKILFEAKNMRKIIVQF